MNWFPWYRRIYWYFRWYVYPRYRYPTRCQYCGVRTGVTMHKWATEDICRCCIPDDYYEEMMND